MAVIVWRDAVTVRVTEMSRKAALDCLSAFEALADADGKEALDKMDNLIMVYAPAAVRVGDGAFIREGVVTFSVGEGDATEAYTVTLPLTAEAANALPYSLAHQWTTAAIEANGWLQALLKNALTPPPAPPSVTG